MTKSVHQTCHNPDTFKYWVVKYGKNASNNKMLNFYMPFIAPVTKALALLFLDSLYKCILYTYHKYGNSDFGKQLLVFVQLTKLLVLFYQNN